MIYYFTSCCDNVQPFGILSGETTPPWDNFVEIVDSSYYITLPGSFSGCVTYGRSNPNYIPNVFVYTSTPTFNPFDDCNDCNSSHPCKPSPQNNTSVITGYINECDVVTITPMIVECNSINPSNNNSSDGQVSVSISGGSAPYTVHWSSSTNPSISSSFIATNLPNGTYSATVTDFYEDFTETIYCTIFTAKDCSFGASITEFIVSPTPTPTPTITPTITKTPTNTPTTTPTITKTPTNTPTISNTPSITPTITPTMTNTPSSSGALLLTCLGTIIPPIVINGVSITEDYTGSVTRPSYGPLTSCTSTTTPDNSLYLGATGPFNYEMSFSVPINNIIVFIIGTGGPGDENFIFTTDTGTGIPTILSNDNCYTTIVGNQILSGSGAPSGPGGGGGGKFLIQNSIDFTKLTISGAGGSNGSVLSICTNSIY